MKLTDLFETFDPTYALKSKSSSALLNVPNPKQFRPMLFKTITDANKYATDNEISALVTVVDLSDVSSSELDSLDTVGLSSLRTMRAA